MSLTRNDVEKILKSIISECKYCLNCTDCKNEQLENLIKDLENIKESKGLNHLGNGFLDNQLPKLQKALLSCNSIQRDKLIKECLQSSTLHNKNNRQYNTITKKRSFLSKLLG